MRTTAPAPIRLLAAFTAALGLSSPALAQESTIGLVADSTSTACLQSGGGPDRRLPVLVSLGEEELALAEPLGPAVACAPLRHLDLVVRLEPPDAWQGAADPQAAAGPWLERLDLFLQSQKGRVRRFELARRPDRRFTPAAYTFLVESVGTLVRSTDPGAELILGPFADGSEPWLEQIDMVRLAPYLRGIALEDPVDLAAWLERLERLLPGSPVRLHMTDMPADAALIRWDAALRLGVEMLLAPASARSAAVLRNLVTALHSRFVTDPSPALRPAAGAGGDPCSVLATLSDPLGPERATILSGPGPLRWEAGPDPVRRVRGVDLATGAPVRAGAVGGSASIEVGEAVGPVLLRFEVERGVRAESETVGVTGEREMTVEEILARLRATEAAQARDLQHYEAKATLSYHYRAESLNESIDVTSVNRFLWQDGVGEYQEVELFVNGARWRGRAPSLPFIAAEKVKEVPLEIRLDRLYGYRLEGRDEIEGCRAFVIAFDPQAGEGPRYSGQVWVDAERFRRLRLRLVQHGLKEPITSNVDVIEYGEAEDANGPVASSGRRSWWLPVRGDRQMVFTALGRSIAVQRRALYAEFSVNAPGFEEARRHAYASGRPVLREDAGGYAYVTQQDGMLRVEPAESLVNVAFFGGLGIGSDGGLTAPFAGLNYFDFDWRGTGTQIDLAVAGPFVDLAWTDPAVAGSRCELTLEARVIGLRERFKRTTEDGRAREEDLEQLAEDLFAVVGLPLTTHQKLEVELELAWDDYNRGDETLRAFVPPPGTTTVSGSLQWRYHRRAAVVDLWVSAGHRLRWDDWGPPDPNAPAGEIRLTGGSREDTDFQRWGLSAIQSFYPTPLQRVDVRASAFAGKRLDRFSRFRIGDFRHLRVRGYDGADLTLDRGVALQLAYKFTPPRGGFSLDFGVDGALIENDQDFTKRHHLAGGAVGASFAGPWGTLVTLRAGFGLGTSMDVQAGRSSLRAVVVKTFDRWPRRRAPAGAEGR